MESRVIYTGIGTHSCFGSDVMRKSCANKIHTEQRPAHSCSLISDMFHSLYISVSEFSSRDLVFADCSLAAALSPSLSESPKSDFLNTWQPRQSTSDVKLASARLSS